MWKTTITFVGFTVAGLCGLLTSTATSTASAAQHQLHRQASKLDHAVIHLQKDLSFFPRNRAYFKVKQELAAVRRLACQIRDAAHHGDFHTLHVAAHRADRHFHKAQSYVPALLQSGHGHAAHHHAAHRGGYPDPQSVRYALKDVSHAMHRLLATVDRLHQGGQAPPSGYGGPGYNQGGYQDGYEGGYNQGGYQSSGYGSPYGNGNGYPVPRRRYGAPSRYGRTPIGRSTRFNGRTAPRISFGNGGIRLHLGG